MKGDLIAENLIVGSTNVITEINTKQDTITDGSLTIERTNGLQDALNRTAKLVSGLSIQSFTGNQQIIGDLESTALMTADEYVVISLTPNLNANLTSKFYVDRELSLKQDIITDGSLTIERTNGLQSLLNEKQATITTSTDLECKSLTTNNLEVDTTRFLIQLC
jgi:hypothetical protein